MNRSRRSPAGPSPAELARAGGFGRVLSDRSPNQWTTSELGDVVALIGYRGARPHPMMRREVAAYHTWLREQLAQRRGQS